ncbi:hypothetical protein [Streptomyces sp. NPDC056242]|uniref:hypothetical protein n=1 Tax=Streptomyces sp. NPDC056242 TaxID=3345760 RepID=UPI0035D8A4BA
MTGVESHDRNTPAVQLGNHEIGGRIVIVRDDRDRASIVCHWSVSFPVSVSPPPWPSGDVPVDGLVPLLVP